MTTKWTNTGFVEGLKIKVTSKELKEHLKARAAYHAKRRDEKTIILPQLESVNEQLKQQPPATAVAQFAKGGMSNSNSYGFKGDDQIEELKRDIETHNNKAIYFDWLSEHLFPEDYSLDKNDLYELELVKR